MQERLWNRNFFLLWQGQAVSFFGGSLYGMAIRLWLAEETNSASLMGIVMMVAAIPSLLLGPLGGAVADRYSKKAVLIACDTANGILGICLAATLYFFPEDKDLGLTVLIFVTIMLDITGVFFGPAIITAIPNLVPKDKISAAYGIAGATMQSTNIIGIMVGGIFYRILGAPTLFLVNGISFLISAFFECFVTIPESEKQIEHKSKKQGLLQDLKDGLRYFKTHRGMKEYVLVVALINFFAAPLIVMMPFYVKDYLHLSVEWYGYFSAVSAAGGLTGAVLAARVQLEPTKRMIFIFLAWMINCLLVGLLGVLDNHYILLVINAVLGILMGFLSIQTMVIIQNATSEEMRGRVVGIMALFKHAISPISMGLSGFVFEMIDRNFTLLFGGTSFIMLLIGAMMILSPPYRDFIKS